MVDLSIIIVNYNLKEYLRECLSSIRQYPGNNHTTEAIVVDNNSSDGSLDMVAREFPEVKTIALSSNRGFSAANNEGMHKSQGENILLLNNDAKIFENTIDYIIEYLDANPAIGCLGCRHVGTNGRSQLTWGEFPSIWTEIKRKITHTLINFGGQLYRWYFEKKYSGAFEVDWVSGSCLAVKREVCERIGLLDENILIYFEDIDWCTKIKRAGWKVVHHSKIPVFHYGGQSAKKFSGLANYQYRVSQLYFWKKYYPTENVWFLRSLIVFRGVGSFINIFLRKLLDTNKNKDETQEEQFQYSKETIKLGWSGKDIR